MMKCFVNIIIVKVILLIKYFYSNDKMYFNIINYANIYIYQLFREYF